MAHSGRNRFNCEDDAVGLVGHVDIMKKLGSRCHMEYITSRKKIGSLLHPVDNKSTRVMVVSSHC